jgi:hypothetical protein
MLLRAQSCRSAGVAVAVMMVRAMQASEHGRH